MDHTGQFEVDWIIENHRIFSYCQRLGWGTQWELARAIQSRRLDCDDLEVPWILTLAGRDVCDVRSLHYRLRVGSSPGLLSDQELQDRSNEELWSELDDERDARVTNDVSLQTLATRHFGKVQFRAHLVFNSGSSATHTIEIRLDEPQLGGSNRFSREYGSESIIRVTIPENLPKEALLQAEQFFPGRTFVLFGRHFEFYDHKDGVIFLIWVSSDRHPDQSSLFGVMNWHNPLELNKDKRVAKWGSRFRLGHSTTAPALLISNNNTHYIDDFDGRTREANPGKIETNYCMTDGCGYANAALLRQLQQQFNWPILPSAVQFRFQGYKGLVLLHPDGKYHNKDTEPTIWLRPSQRKIEMDESKLSKNQRIFEVCSPARLNTPSRLSPETIINLAYNGISEGLLSKIVELQLQATYEELTDWDSPHAMPRLCFNILHKGGLQEARLQRITREQPYPWSEGGARETKPIDGSSEGNETPNEWFPDPISGCPASLEEAAFDLLMAGFKPQTCPMLADKMGHIIKRRMKATVENSRILVGMSATARCAPVPEPFRHLLNEDEIHFLSSSQNLQLADGGFGWSPSGEGLITRYPCKVPSDIQKVKITNHPELREYTDIILMPIECRRSMASMLGGGDYDGDIILLIWQPELVKAFIDPPSSFADSPPDLDENFDESRETVEDLCNRFPDYQFDFTAERELIRELQINLLQGMATQNLVGRYSVWHDKAVALSGYDHPKTIRLAYMFCTLLDSSKSGKRVRESVFRQDLDEWDHYEDPAWKGPWDESKESQSMKTILRGSTPGMENLKKKAVSKRDELISEYKKFRSQFSIDEDLSRVWEEEVHRLDQMERTDPVLADFMKVELELIRNHVEAERKKSQTLTTVFTNLPIRERQLQLRQESANFDDGPKGLDFFDTTRVRRLRASYAYIYDHEFCKSQGQRKWSQWPWNVAMRELCGIKATSSRAGVVHYNTEMSQYLGIHSTRRLLGSVHEQQYSL